MRISKVLAITLLSLGTLLSSSLVSAQDSLIELVRSGQRDVALSAINSAGVDVNATEPDGSTALLWAAYSVDRELVAALLDAGAKADITNNYGSTPLTEAVKVGDLELVRMLLKAGANPDSPNQDMQTALMLASNIGLFEIAKLLIDDGADVNVVETFRGQTALMWAAAENHPDIVELLIANGASAEVDRRAVHDDWPRQMTSEPRAQFRPTGGLTALLYAARSGCYRCAVAIVEAGADINKPNPDGVTPLINALDSKSFDIAMYLLDKGANASAWDMNGRTPLFVAVDMNTFTPRGFGGFGGGAVERDQEEMGVTAMDVVNRLIEMGVDVNHELTRIRPNGPGRGRFADYDMRGGTAALMIATMSDDHEAMEVLLANGAEVDLKNAFRITPLMMAAGMTGTGRPLTSRGQGDRQSVAIKTIDLLLDAGADINAQVLDSHTFTAKLDTYVQGRDLEGYTALFSAAESGWDRVVKHMIERGADPSIKNALGQTVLDVVLAAGGAPAGAGRQGPPGGGDRDATIALLDALLGDSALEVN